MGHRFEKGDHACIIGNYSDHGFEICEEVEIVSGQRRSILLGLHYRVEGRYDWWWVNEGDLEKL